MEKRVFLAILLSFVVLAVYQSFFAPPQPVTPPGAAVEGGTPTPAAPPAAGAPAGAALAPGATPAPGDAPRAQVATVIADAAARDIVVETDAVQAVFSTEGATLRHWRLKKEQYRDGAGAPLDLVPDDVPPQFAHPFTLSTDNADQSAVLRRALYLPSTDGLTLGRTPGTVTFEYKDESGLHARKTFQFQPEGKKYLLRVEASVDVNGASRPVTLEWGPALGLGYRPDGSREVPAQGLQFVDAKVHRLPVKTIVEQGHYEGTPVFAGVEEQYFLSVVLPATQAVKVDYQAITLPVAGNPKVQRHFIGYSVGVPGAASLTYFMGPKDLDELRAVEPQLVTAIDFGIFAFLVVPLLKSLKWFNTYLHNYGWSIIALTVTINIIIFPLRHRSMVSMKKMQALQPEMKAIQDRYAKYKVTDPERQKMNTEMMALYKQKGVHPASGCVPMLLTLPVLWAFYNLLYYSIELRGEPFLGWIHDLALHDPLYITPVVMGATMFWQQKMMPTTADPIQAKMFLFMPLIFTVTFLWAPAGLVIYWLVSNILTIGQQYLTNRIIAAPARTAVIRRK